jgi:hypothetical protein
MRNFSLESYRSLLQTFQEAHYSFCMFEEIDQCLNDGLPFVVLRHDIDISLWAALEIAYVEHELGIQATYFVPLNSPFYNTLSGPNAANLSQLYHMGHQIATHVDLKAYNGNCAEALTEVEVLAHFYPYINRQIVSLHSPTSLQSILMDDFRQLKNVYGHSLKNEVAYISDSTGHWRYGHPLDSEAFYTRKPIHLLTHPIWWIQEGESSRQKLEHLLQHDYLNNLALAREYLPKLYSMEYTEAISQEVR